MSRVAKKPVVIPKGVEVTVKGSTINFKGGKGTLSLELNNTVEMKQENGELKFSALGTSKTARACAGTMRALANNMVTGVTKGFERKLTLVGVGYRAQAQGAKLNLTLGFSHPVVYDVPKGVSIETPSQTEVVVKGVDKHLVGQVAADIRAYRPPEPYKGKGVRFAEEKITLKEIKKK